METHQPPVHPIDSRTSFLEEKAFKSRTVLLFGPINDTVAQDIVRRLIALAADSNEPIDMLVSSPGGHLESGDSIHDVVRFIGAPVNMIGTGWVGSAATHVYLSVPRERRFCLPNTRFLIHQPSGGAGGQATDIAIQAKEIIKARERIARTIARETGQPFERVMADIERDRWLSPEEAVDYGLVGRVIERQADLRG
ncbi:MAG TPA: ATP-dependent Clp protease proteolytic subunit [Burkholderiaceae bacterium]|nr:ATP-dependent Clp protease proteolytic subunit [Burkholderiaceae bacterium]